MSHQDAENIHDELQTSASPNYIGNILASHISRRQVLKGSAALAAATALPVALSACSDNDGNGNNASVPASKKLSFAAVAKNTADGVALPAGYQATVLLATGDPLSNAVGEYLNNGSDVGSDQRAGDHHDGMYYFGLSDTGGFDINRSDKGLLCLNFENINQQYLHTSIPDNTMPRNSGEVRKEIDNHGVGVIEVGKSASTWAVNKASSLNRRITPQSECDLRGPVRGSRFVQTKFSTNGISSRGTLNNCAYGYTPWGTYLTCEENWAGYFANTDTGSNLRKENSRYGINASGAGTRGNYNWASPTDGVADEFTRWNNSVTSATSAAADYRNEANTFGWVVEIDPFTRTSRPQKRTAMGRMAHECAYPGPIKTGKPLVFYMGDDSRFEYMYKYVSRRNWREPLPGVNRLSMGDEFLDDGTLYVAKFNADGTGTWIALVHGQNGLNEDNALYSFTSQAAVLVNTRMAADSVGATKMDRPEWCAVSPSSGEVYVTLTNNSNRGQGSNAGVDAANPRNYTDTRGAATLRGNVNGHIIRMREDGDENAATTFTWDIYLFGAQADADPATVNVSGLTADNDFSSPDGLWFDRRGVLWVQTDDGAYVDQTNCMMLAALPGTRGDGAAVTIGSQATFKGANASSDNLRRFMVGPKDCEITGVDITPDGKAMFLNIQHPGETGDLSTFTSRWPHSLSDATAGSGGSARPRSATIVITRTDGGPIAL